MELARSRSATIISTSSANCLHHSCYLMKLLLSALMVISCIIAGPNLCSVPCNAQSPLSSGDLQALLRFKAKLQDPLRKLSTWSGSNGDPCTTWYGVNCANAPENSSSSSSSSSSLGVNAKVVVSELRLGGSRLGGGSAEEPLLSIVASLLGSLDTIRVLDLSDNAFQGGIGAGFGPVGCGPSSIIQEINLSFNNLSGILPQDMSFQCGTLSKLDLSHNRLTGALPSGANGGSSSSSSGFLTDLNLSYNSLSGEIPEESGLFFGSSPNLKSLDLSANHLSGTLPDSIFTQHCGNGLEYLDLSSNELSGPIPPSLLQKCTSLQYLNLSNNNIGGRFDTAPFGLGSLKTLDISNNSLAGPIPSGLGDSACSNLVALNLSMNNLSGSIPQSFASCASLASIDLSYNNMSGELPADTLSEMRALEILVLSFNQFSGALPTSILTSQTLKVLDMGSNKLSGALPSLPPTSNLEEFLVPNNGFSGKIPVAFGNASRLKVLDLSFNHLQGPIPHELGLLSQLEKLSIWYNNLSGEIPYTIGYLSKLRILILNNNALSGAIPEGIANCTSLEWISLSSNNLTGCIPASIGTMRSLTLLDLGNNGLYGVIPPEIANASMFVWVDLHNNRLTGPIPPGLGSHPGRAPASRVTGVVFAFIRNNLLNGCRGMGTLLEFEGITEEALAPTPLMTSCNSSRLYLGDVLNKDPDLTSVQYLDLSYNSLDGTIPDEMGDLTALVMLSLAHNELVGTIPASFIHLAGLGVLDLSYNKLQGSMSPLANCSFLVSIDVSNNNFSGSIPSTGQLSTTPAQGFLGNPLLCGEPLPACGSNNLQSRNCTPDGSNNCGSARHNRMSVLPWANSIVLGILSAVAFICMIIVWGIMMRAKGKHKDTDNMLTNLQLGSCHGNSSGWNLGGEKEPLSINVATFERPLRKLTFAQLIEATNGFSQESLIGIGGFGEVYKAELKDGSIVAIKKLLQFSYQGDREFTAEMETLGKIKHRNLVPLLGYCKVGEERLLVYEYMHGGSLDDMLHGDDATNGEGKKQKLTWDLRKRIARGAARGLSFLHHNCIPHIIHRDMKSSNVLLDQSMEARVSDFGMARLISALDTHLSVSTLAGTPGYVPPEYYQSFRCTTKGDIYSFGVILLELLTGKRPTDKEFFEDTNLVGWVRQLVNENKSLETLDPSLRDGCNANDELEMLQYLRIACDCVQDQPSKRPSMLEIVSMLKELQVQEGLRH